MRVIGYMRVSTEEQGDSRAGLEAQEAAIRAEVERRGWDLIDLRSDVASGKSLRRRDRLGETLRDLAAGQADALVVAKLDRLSRSVLDFAGIMEMAAKEGWSLAVLDLGVDTTTPNGELVANIMISMAQWERRIIGDRTKAALKAVRARGTHVGRKANVSPEVLRTIKTMRAAGLSWQRIADALEASGVPTSQGGRWHAATVRRLHPTAR
jgi:DNA invertase Pin-like site-specific DNA recombinase